jgi:phosphoribosyl 1,2-cyclic phosphate phosphodiesterase
VDHILGLDDVYPFNMWSENPLPAYGSEATLKEIAITFRHLFDGKGYPGIPSVELIPIAGKFRLGHMEIEPIDVMHGQMPVLGYRFGNLAYLTDVSFIPESSFERLKGVEYLVLDGLRYQSHPTHFSLPEAVEAASRIGARQTYLVHICHDVDHDEGNDYLPDTVNLAHDGLVLEV